MEPQAMFVYAEAAMENGEQRWFKYVFWTESTEEAARQAFEYLAGSGGRLTVRQIEVYAAEPDRYTPEFAVSGRKQLQAQLKTTDVRRA